MDKRKKNSKQRRPSIAERSAREWVQGGRDETPYLESAIGQEWERRKRKTDAECRSPETVKE